MGNYSTPGGQNADILRATINGDPYDGEPTSEISELLLELKEVIEAGGGGGGTTNYNSLSNKPQINSVTLQGNKSLSDLGINIPTVDAALSGTSENPVQNKVIKAALDNKQDNLTIDTEISSSSTNPVQNKAIGTKFADYYTKTQIDDLLAAIDTVHFEVVAALPTTDISTTTIYLLETATPGLYDMYIYVNNEWIYIGQTNVDLSNYYTKTQTDTLLNAKQNTLTFDNAPTSGSVNPVKSGGIYTALEGKQDTLTFDDAPTSSSANPVKSGGIYTALAGKQDTLTFDSTPTSDSNNPVTSDGIYMALDGKQDILDFDYVPTENSENPVQSGGIYDAISAVNNKLYSTISGLQQDPNTGSIEAIELDLDDITTTGLYVVADCDNSPFEAGGLLVIGLGVNDTFQLIGDLQTGVVKTRVRRNDTWGDWSESNNIIHG